MSKHQGDADDTSNNDESSDNNRKLSKAGLKIVKNEPLPVDLLGKQFSPSLVCN